MRITFVCDILGEANNGTSIATYNFINTLKDAGHEIHIVCPDQDKRGVAGYYVVPIFRLGPVDNYIKKNGVVISKRDDTVLMRAIRGSDLVHISVPFGLGKRATTICRKYGIPMTASFHVQAENVSSHFFVMHSKLMNHLIYVYFYNTVFKYADAIHYPTEFIHNEFEKQIRHKTNAYVISNGVNKDFKPKKVTRPNEYKDRILILFSGRYSKEKKHSTLIKAVKYSKYKDKIQLVFAGDGPRHTYINELAEKEKLKYKPILKFYNHNEIIETINMCDLYVHPSYAEIEAISCLEAISCGLVPVIANAKKSATRCFALGPKNLFKPDNAKDLAKKIDYWIDHPEEKEKCRKEYLGYTSRFDHDDCMKRMLEMVESISKIHKEKDAIR